MTTRKGWREPRLLGMGTQSKTVMLVNRNEDHNKLLDYTIIESKYYEDLDVATQANYLADNNNSYNIYIQISLEKDQKLTYQTNTRARLEQNGFRKITWKWGSEKRFFDYLNVLCDELTKTDLNSYINEKNRFTTTNAKKIQPIQVLGMLWKEYRDTEFPNNSNIPNFNDLRNKISKIDFDKNRDFVFRHSQGGARALTSVPNATLGPLINQVYEYMNNIARISRTNPIKNGTAAVVEKTIKDLSVKLVQIMVQAAILQSQQGTHNSGNIYIAMLTVIAFATPAAANSAAGNPDNCTVEGILEAAGKALTAHITAGTVAEFASIIAGSVADPGNGTDVRDAIRAINMAGGDLTIPDATRDAISDILDGLKPTDATTAGVTVTGNALANAIFEFATAVRALQVPAGTIPIIQATTPALMNVGGAPLNDLAHFDMNAPNGDIVNALYEHINTQIISIPKTAGAAATDYYKLTPAAIKSLLKFRSKLMRHIFQRNHCMIFFTQGADFVGSNMINSEGKTYILGIINMYLTLYDKHYLTKTHILPKDYIIAFVWNAYDPGVDRYAKKSIKLQRLKKNEYFNEIPGTPADEILYFREIKGMFGKFIKHNALYLAGSTTAPTNAIRYRGTGANETLRNNESPLFANNGAYSTFVENASDKKNVLITSVRTEMSQRFAATMHYLSNNRNPTGATIFSNVIGYDTENNFWNAFAKLSKRYKDIVVKILELSMEGANVNDAIQTKIKFPSNIEVPLYVKLVQVNTFVWVLLNKKTEYVINSLTTNNQIVDIPNKPTVALMRALKTNTGKTIVSNLTGGKKKSSSSKSKSAKSKSSSKSSKSTKSSKSSSTKSKSSKSTKTKKSRK
jgi:hypothetical protein